MRTVQIAFFSGVVAELKEVIKILFLSFFLDRNLIFVALETIETPVFLK